MSVVSRAVEAWQRWLFARGGLRGLALYRIGWALAMLIAARHEAGLFQLYSVDQYHAPLLDWAVPLGRDAFQRLMLAAQLGCVLTLIGLFWRLGAVLVIAALGYLFASDALLFRNHIYLGLLTGALLCASPCGRALSVTAYWRRRSARADSVEGSLLVAQLIKAQILIVYGYSALNKLRLPFLDGFTLQQELPYAFRSSPLRAWLCAEDGSLRPAVESVLHSVPAMAACSCAVVLVEGFLVFGLPSRRWRGLATALGVGLHGSIFLFMDIRVFGLLMVSAYPLFWARDAPVAHSSPPSN
jgi:hypothetical protein